MRFLTCLFLFLITTAFNKEDFKTNWNAIKRFDERSEFTKNDLFEETKEQPSSFYSCLEIPECITQCAESKEDAYSEDVLKECMKKCEGPTGCLTKCLRNEKCKDKFKILAETIRVEEIKKEMWTALLKNTKWNLIRNYYKYGIGVKSEDFISYREFTDFLDKITKHHYQYVNIDSQKILLEDKEPYIYVSSLRTDQDRLNCDIVYPNPMLGLPFVPTMGEGIANTLTCLFGDECVMCATGDLTHTRHCSGNFCKKKQLHYSKWFSRKKHEDYITKFYEEENEYQQNIHVGLVKYIHKALAADIYEKLVRGERPAFELVEDALALPSHKLPDFLLEDIAEYNQGMKEFYMKCRYFVDRKTFYKIRKTVFERIKSEEAKRQTSDFPS